MEIEAARTLLTVSNIALAVCAVIVALGTYGTFHANSIIEKYDENRQAQTDLKIAEASKASSLADARAADANLKSAEANERASKLENETSLLKKQAEEAKAETARVNERLQKMQTARSLRPEQADKISDFLKSDKFITSPPAIFRVASVGDSEAQIFASQFLEIFLSCGVDISRSWGVPLPCHQTSDLEAGLLMSIPSMDIIPETQPFVHFSHLMDAIGLNMELSVDPMLRKNEAILNVLRKPKEI